jgi:S-adenosylmethionine synthetase
MEQCVVWLCSRIGAPIDQPQVAAVQVTLKAGTKISDVAERARKIVRSELQRMPEFCMELVRGEYSIC